MVFDIGSSLQESHAAAGNSIPQKRSNVDAKKGPEQTEKNIAPEYIPRPLSAYTITLMPSHTNISAYGHNRAATPPSSDPGSKRRGHDGNEEEQEREPKTDAKSVA